MLKRTLSSDSTVSNGSASVSESGSVLTPMSNPTSPAFSYYDDDDMSTDKISILDLLDPLAMSTQLSKKVTTSVRRKGAEWKERVVKIRDKEDLERLKRQLLVRVEKIEKRLTSEKAISLTEKLTFSFGVLNIFLNGFIMGASPEQFHVLYTIESLILLPIRVYTYKRKGYQYFLADLCYFVNCMMLLFIWVFPQSEQLYVSCYALAFGTLSFAVITWRNSLVLHSLDKTTSTFIHVLPPAVLHVITHMLDDDYKAERFPGAARVENWRFTYGILWASIAYFVWQSLYHYFITHLRKDKIRSGRVTSFEWLRKSYSKSWMGKLVNGLPEPFPVVAFTLIQFGYQLGTMMLCPIWFRSSILSAAFITYIFFTACYNGATYYLDIFGKRFQKELLKLQEQVASTDIQPTSSPELSTRHASSFTSATAAAAAASNAAPEAAVTTGHDYNSIKESPS